MHYGKRLPHAVGSTCLLVSALLTACGGGSGGSGEETGIIRLSVTDAPVEDASSVVVQFRSVAFKREGSAPERIENIGSSPRQIDLLQFQEGRAALCYSMTSPCLPAAISGFASSSTTSRMSAIRT